MSEAEHGHDHPHEEPTQLQVPMEYRIQHLHAQVQSGASENAELRAQVAFQSEVIKALQGQLQAQANEKAADSPQPPKPLQNRETRRSTKKAVGRTKTR